MWRRLICGKGKSDCLYIVPARGMITNPYCYAVTFELSTCAQVPWRYEVFAAVLPALCQSDLRCVVRTLIRKDHIEAQFIVSCYRYLPSSSDHTLPLPLTGDSSFVCSLKVL
jgi:hypothetical protein